MCSIKQSVNRIGGGTLNISIHSIKITTIVNVGSFNIGMTILSCNKNVTVNESVAEQGAETGQSESITPEVDVPFTESELPGEGVPFGGIVPSVSRKTHGQPEEGYQ
jgi:hypothetical protein